MMKVLDLFSGIGGFSLGLEATGGFETVAFCEIDDYARQILRKHWPDVPIYQDVRDLSYVGPNIDVLTGGFPCQPFSHAGVQRGDEDNRNLWNEMLAAIEALRPRWVIGENVTGIINMELDTVLHDLETLGYSTRAFVIPAGAIGTPQRRARVWILANSEGIPVWTRSREAGAQAVWRPGPSNSGGNVPNANGSGQYSRGARQEGNDPRLCGPVLGNAAGSRGKAGISTSTSGQGGHSEEPIDRSDRGGGWPGKREWPAEPGVCRVVDGLPNRVDRIRCLGNSVVPQLVEQIGMAILETEKGNPPVLTPEG